MLFERGTVAQIVVEGNAGIVDEDVERVDALTAGSIWAASVTSRVAE